mmetsp:Transcript_84468/g.225713  ORF Transcript_84468/g.225713 Transcript_84468/m.225713 type:complete len:257 (+) Transcript_84468:61-831(+)
MAVLVFEQLVCFVCAAIFGCSALVFLLKDRSKSDVADEEFGTTVSSRRFRVLTSVIALVAATCYGLMGCGYGVTSHGQNFWWLRYVDWAITTPLLLVDLALLAGLDVWDTFALVVADMLMIAFGYAGAEPNFEYTWPHFGVGMVLFLLIMYIVVEGLLEHANDPTTADDKEAVVKQLLWLTAITWSVYPVIFVLEQSVLSNADDAVVSRSTVVLFYAAADVVAKVVFGFILLRDDTLLHVAMPTAPLEMVGIAARA